MMHHLTLLSTPPKPVRLERSEHLSERKRALFPPLSQDSDDSDIGHMSPLEYSSSPDSCQTSSQLGVWRYFGLDKTNISSGRFSPGLELIEHSDESNDDEFFGKSYFQNQENINPRTSPKKHKSVTFESVQNEIIKTPEITTDTSTMSPTEILKTPHDSSNTNLKVPRLVRKSLIDITNFDSSRIKRKAESPIESTEPKTIKVEHQSKTSKARTALFPESIFPAKSFYPKTELHKTPIHFIDLTQKTKKVVKKSPTVYLCNRSRGKNQKRYLGQINAGVRHGIKKPRLKPALTKNQLLKAALNIVKNSPLNDYFDQFDNKNSSENECGVSFQQIQKMDSILKNIDVRSNQFPPETSLRPGIETRMKRSLSPQPDQPEHTRKFFKSEHSKATVTINNIKLKLEHGEFSLIEKQTRTRRIKREIYDPNDFSFEENVNKISDNSFNDILKSLEEDNIISPVDHHQHVLTAHNSVIQSENKIQLHNPVKNPKQLNNNMLLSPTSLVCDLTSGLALDSPKNQHVTTGILDKLSTLKKRISFPEPMDNQPAKLFPIFCGKQNDPKPKENKHVKNIRKIWKPLSEDQTIIDAGQKKFGLTQCQECKCVYSLGEPEDEIMHFKHHNSISALKYNNWKHERVVSHFSNGKVIQINPNDPKTWWKKVKEIVEVINRDLGFVDVPFDSFNKKVFLCIINKQIVGCLVSEPKSYGHKMLPNQDNIDQCTEESYPIKCGVSRLWVAVTHRKKGVATCLMNAMRSNFVYGYILSTHEIAFSAPTDAGKKFASKYTKTDEFLIYTL